MGTAKVGESEMKAPIPRPTETKDDRMKCGQRKSRTVKEIDYDIEFQLNCGRKNLRRIIE